MIPEIVIACIGCLIAIGTILGAFAGALWMVRKFDGGDK